MKPIYRFLLVYKFADAARENTFHSKVHELYDKVLEIQPFSYAIETQDSAEKTYQKFADMIMQEDYIIVCELTHRCKATDPKLLDFSYFGASK